MADIIRLEIHDIRRKPLSPVRFNKGNSAFKVWYVADIESGELLFDSSEIVLREPKTGEVLIKRSQVWVKKKDKSLYSVEEHIFDEKDGEWRVVLFPFGWPFQKMSPDKMALRAVYFRQLFKHVNDAVAFPSRRVAPVAVLRPKEGL